MEPDTSIQKVVITGGSSGIGRSLTQKFASAGFDVINADINPPKKEIGHFILVDLTQPDQVDQLINKVKDLWGAGPDVLICNAGRGVHNKLTEGYPDEWENIFRLNVFSAFRLIRAFVPEMQNRGSGDVVFISSISADHAYIYGGIYTATKAAIEQLAETLRLEVQPEVRVTVVRPGVVDTRFFKNMINGSQTPESIGWGSINPDQIADSVLYAVNQPREMMLNNIELRPVAQTM